LARQDIIKAARNNQTGLAYDVPAVSRINGEPVEGYSDKYVVYPSNWGRLKTYEAPDGSIVTFRSRSKVQHIAYDQDKSRLVTRKSIGRTEGFTKIKKR
jgi:hypothetical protein